MHNPQLIKSFDAVGDIADHRIVYMDSYGNAKQADGPNGALLGTTELACGTGSRVDVVMDGIVEVQAGCYVQIGDWLTSDSAGKAIIAGENDDIVGIALAIAGPDEYVTMRMAHSRPAAMPRNYISMGVIGSAAVVANRIVKIGSDGMWAQASSASDSLAGIAMVDSDPDNNFDAVIAGVAEVVAGGSIAAGDFVTADSNGKAVAAAYTNSYVGMALAGASADEMLPVAIHLGKLEHEEVGGSPAG